MSHIADASRLCLPECPTCHAWAGDPCRTPSWRTRKPHRERLAESAPSNSDEGLSSHPSVSGTPELLAGEVKP